MPNWCENFLKVTGKKEDLKEFADFMKFDRKQREYLREFYIKELGEPKELPKGSNPMEHLRYPKDGSLSFNSFIPYPPLLNYNDGGYEWCCKNWGTKWEPYEIEERFEEDAVAFSFDTAWAPPAPVVVAMSKKFPKLEFSLYYAEMGCDFSGEFVVANGAVLKDVTGDYSEHYGSIDEEEEL